MYRLFSELFVYISNIGGHLGAEVYDSDLPRRSVPERNHQFRLLMHFPILAEASQVRAVCAYENCRSWIRAENLKVKKKII